MITISRRSLLATALRSSSDEKTPVFEWAAEVAEDGFFESDDVITVSSLYNDV
jgi:hypothetical protein